MTDLTTSVHQPQPVSAADDERRVSIWSVPVDFSPWFYLLLVAHTSPLVYLLSWTELTEAPHDNIANIIVNVTSGAAPMIFVAAVTTIIELEVLMVLREWYRHRISNVRQESFNEGYNKRVEEEQAMSDKQKLEDAAKNAFEAGRKAEREAMITYTKQIEQDESE